MTNSEGASIGESFMRRRFAGEAAAILGAAGVNGEDATARALDELNDRLRGLSPREVEYEVQLDLRGGDED